MCNLNKEKMYLFSFALSHMLTMFLPIFSDCTSQLKLSFFFFVSCSLWNSLKNWPNMARSFSSLFLLQLTAQGRMASVFFLSFFLVSACPTRLTTLLFKTSQTSPCFSHFSINEKACFEDFWNKLLTRQVGWKKRVSRVPNKMYF